MRPLLLGLASLLVPGLGQFLLGQRGKGVLILVVGPVVCCWLGFWNVFAALDAWALARKLDRGEAVRRWESWWLLDTVARLADEL